MVLLTEVPFAQVIVKRSEYNSKACSTTDMKRQISCEKVMMTEAVEFQANF